jgi:predicted negative regulator of RcsB-dependent stress response
MDTLTVLGAVVVVLQLVIISFGKVLWHNFQEVRKRGEANSKELADFKLHCSETFSTKDDLTKAIEQFSRSIDAVFAKLERIEDKLDHKQDKA